MPEFNEQTSASDRYAAARKALAEYEAWADYAYAFDIAGEVLDMAEALRILITPPSTSETVEQIVRRLIGTYTLTEECYQVVEVALTDGVRAGIQNAHESWEPEVALRPTQEQMLRWLNLDYTEDGDMIIVHRKQIERED